MGRVTRARDPTKEHAPGLAPGPRAWCGPCPRQRRTKRSLHDHRGLALHHGRIVRMHRHRVAVMVVVVVLLHLVGPLSDGAAGEPDWMPLSDGTLAGWKKVGGEATYRVEGDSIVGQVGPGPNTFLRTER